MNGLGYLLGAFPDRIERHEVQNDWFQVRRKSLPLDRSNACFDAVEAENQEGRCMELKDATLNSTTSPCFVATRRVYKPGIRGQNTRHLGP